MTDVVPEAGAPARNSSAVRLSPVRLPGPAASDAAALIGMIERAASDPTVDLDRLERMYDMYERATTRSAKSAYLQALTAARLQIPTIVKRGEITTNKSRDDKTKVRQSTYAKWEDVVDTILPPLQQNNLVLTFRTSQTDLDRVSVTAVLSHVDGHSEESQMALPIENGGSKNNAQGWGSSVSYGKRYTAFALLNLVGRDEDNDGRGAMLDDEQQAAIMTRIGEAGADIGKFLAYFNSESLSDMPADKYEEAMSMLNAKATKATKASNGGQPPAGGQ